MTKQYDLNDNGVVVVIGSGAGGGTLSNELAQKGVDVVCLEPVPVSIFARISSTTSGRCLAKKPGWIPARHPEAGKWREISPACRLDL